MGIDNFKFIIILIAFSLSSPCESAIKEDIEAGKKIYEKKCQYCHGITGKGDGPASNFLNPKPRNFTQALYKIRSTFSNELPTDEDIFNVITKGMPGTSMPGWVQLSEKQRLQLVHYIKTFSERFTKEKPRQILFGKELSSTSKSIQKGKEIYQKMKCFLCHGDESRGDGVITTTLWNEWKIPFYARNLTKAWTFKGGNTSRDIYRTISTGMNGTPMGSYMDYLNEEEQWYLAHYINSISKKEVSEVKVVLKSKLVKGVLPDNPNDPSWESVDSITIPLTGQVITSLRLQNPSVDYITIKSFYNEQEIVFLLEWDDRTKNDLHKEIPKYENSTSESAYPEIIFQPQDEMFRDSVGIQFPVEIYEGSQKPYFLLGDVDRPVNIWKYKSDLQEVEEIIATGYENPIRTEALENQNVEGKGIWNNGKWKVVMKRKLKTNENENITFEIGKLIPFSFYVWDGSNNEKELKSSISTWYYLLLESPVPTRVYIYPFLAFVFAIVVEFHIIRKLRQKNERTKI